MTMGQLHDQPPGHGQARGIHGMLVFGGQHTDSQFRSPVYVSHLPMFMHPHEFQVIARVSGTAAGIYGDFAAHFGTSTIYTFKPEPFSIDELDPSGGGARPAHRSPGRCSAGTSNAEASRSAPTSRPISSRSCTSGDSARTPETPGITCATSASAAAIWRSWPT